MSRAWGLGPSAFDPRSSHGRDRAGAFGAFGIRSLGSLCAFLVVHAVGTPEGSGQMDAYKGLAQRSPVLALSLLVFLLSLGGIPFVAGFWAKLFIFRAVINQQMYALALLGAVATIVALYYHLVLSSRMYVDAPDRRTPVAVPMPLLLALLVCAVGTVVMGMYPEPWVQAVMAAAKGLFQPQPSRDRPSYSLGVARGQACASPRGSSALLGRST